MKKGKGRIRQTKTDWQKQIDDKGLEIKTVSWQDRLPEFIHISFSLLDNDYKTVKNDFNKIADIVNTKYKPESKFCFTLSQAFEIILKDKSILENIFETSFKVAFEHLLDFYSPLFNIPTITSPQIDYSKLMKSYSQILDGKSESSILCKFIILQYIGINVNSNITIPNFTTTAEILKEENKSLIMALFVTFVSNADAICLYFCDDVWLFNFFNAPPLFTPDDTKDVEVRFKDMKIEEYANEFKTLYHDFRKINLLAHYSPLIAEVNFGFVARICNLTLDILDFIKIHKGEIAELVYRSALESFIVGLWLLKQQDWQLYKRFKDYSTGKQKFLLEKIGERSRHEVIQKSINKLIDDTIKEEGFNAFQVASERGDIFDLRLDEMAEELWGKNNHYYFLYKRSSEVTHGHWKIMAKYHLTRSNNPLHNKFNWYNENPNHFAGLIPAFYSLDIAIKYLITMLKDINNDVHKELLLKLENLSERIWDQFKIHYNKYFSKDHNIDEI